MKLSRPTLILAAIVLLGACKPEEKAELGKKGAAQASKPAPVAAPAPGAAKSLLPSKPAVADEKAKQDSGKLFDGSSPAAGSLAKLTGTDEAAVPVPAASSGDKARAEASLTALASEPIKLDDPARAPAAPKAPKAGVMESLLVRKRAALETAAKLVTRTKEVVEDKIVEPVKAFAEKTVAKAGTFYAGAKQGAAEVFEKAKEVAAPVVAKVQEKVVEPVVALSKKAETLYASAKQGVARTYEKAKEAAASAGAKVTEVASKVKAEVQERAAPVIAKVSETASQVKAAVSAKIDSTAKLAKGLFDGAAKRWQAWRGKDKGDLEAKVPAVPRAGDL
ncbi:MAG TPA: hypothetical protein DCM05_12490 [Elusimicrobia bacterium]|nr:hypothetical protein [Elusimicrobiota bacterium]